jgi:hypothetical protein
MFSSVAPWIQGGAVSILAAAVWMLFTGRLVPRRVHDAGGRPGAGAGQRSGGTPTGRPTPAPTCSTGR